MHASIPSPPPEWSSLSLGPLTVHMYAIMILIGIFVALWLTTRRWVERGGDPDAVGSIAIWAIPFGIIGGRIYHVISSPAAYFGEGGNPWKAFEIWNGGLGIWGAVALGALGAYIGARRAGASFTAFLDAAAPAVLIAQAIGRLGNYFNQELFGAPTSLPWGLEIDPAFRPEGYEQFATFHPTFLYELLWNLAGAALIIYLDKKWDLRGGRVFWLYVVVYTTGRLWIENVRIDEAVHIAGLRVNVWVSILVLLGALIAFVMLGRAQARLSERVPRSQLAAPRVTTPDEVSEGTRGVTPGDGQVEDTTEHSTAGTIPAGDGDELGQKGGSDSDGKEDKA
ncbi:prolipoprotein diacylglyceryl transferase [Demequina aurantiaca]|uniref:prolipoprotein diacylglyceryl transferase n=1 Tax=Demequina aurantiaca TaxID=676200 RepID=UPI0009FD8A6C|nr:prolipoprotein diacylglyceryl transferase [Demequina aurantiaca]